MELAEFEKTLATKPPRRFMTGDKILGRYRITGALGQGGMGTVFQCWDEVGGIDVALKAIPPELSHDTNEMEAVRDNFRLVEKLHHPHIAAAKTLEKDSATGDYYLIMECVEGLNLRKYLKRGGGKLALDIVLPVVKQVANALDYAHSQKIMHRDIKPSNIMIMANGTVKVLDFGLAAQLHTSLTRVSLVHYGTSGTGPYMAPEQWRGKFQDAATDQYALGVMVYELLSGRVPFESHEAAVLREAVLNEIPEKPAELDEAEWGVLKKALAKSRDERFANCEAFVQALEKAATGKNAMDITDATRAVERTLKTMKDEPATKRTFAQPVHRVRSLLKPSVVVFGIALVAAAAFFLVGRGCLHTSEYKRIAQRPHEEIESNSPSLLPVRGELKIGSVVAPPQASATLADLAPLKSEAELKWNRVKGLDRGQGFGDKLDAVEVILGTATTLYEAKEYAPALAKYYDLVAGCAQIQGLERQRKDAREGLDKAQKAKRAAEEARASEDAKELWNGAVKLNEEAASLFDKEEFANAAKTWDASTKEFKKATEWAEELRAVRAAKAAYEDAIGKVDIKKLDEFGGKEWVDVKAAAGKAAALDRDARWDGSIAQWKEAAVGLEKAFALAAFRSIEKESKDWVTKVDPIIHGPSGITGSQSALKVLAMEVEALLSNFDVVNIDLLSSEQKARLTYLKSNIERIESEIDAVPQFDQPWKNTLGMEFVPVPGTDVLFCKWETRVQDYLQFVNETGQKWFKPHFEQGPTHPVVNVSWNDARAFCKWLTTKERQSGNIASDQVYRLPTDAEWSVAVGLNESQDGMPKDKEAKSRNVYPWNKGRGVWPPPRGVGNYDLLLKTDAYANTSPVESFEGNANGLYDMGGNVWEWCEDLYKLSEDWRVLRGGSWYDSGFEYLLSSSRVGLPPLFHNDNYGFRVVLGLTSSKVD